MNRIYISEDDVSRAILAAGIKLRPEDCLATKFAQIAADLTKQVHKRLRPTLREFSERLLGIEVKPQ